MHIQHYNHYSTISTSQPSKTNLKVIKKINFPSKKLNSSKKIFPHILACASQTQNTSIMKSAHCIIKKNMFKLFFDDLIFFWGVIGKTIITIRKSILEKEYTWQGRLGGLGRRRHVRVIAQGTRKHSKHGSWLPGWLVVWLLGWFASSLSWS